MKAYYRPFKGEDYIEVLNMQLREADKEELEAATGFYWNDALKLAVRNSRHTWVIIYRDKIEGIFGLGDGIGGLGDEIGHGIPWFVATNKFDSFSFTVGKQSKEIIKMFLKIYPRLENYVYSKHFTAIRWLKWLGFIVSNEYVYFNDKNVPFQKFYMRRSDE